METYLPSLFFEAFAIIVLTAVRSTAVPLGNLPPIRVVRFRMPPYDAKLGRIQHAKWALLFFVRQLDGFATPYQLPLRNDPFVRKSVTKRIRHSLSLAVATPDRPAPGLLSTCRPPPAAAGPEAAVTKRSFRKEIRCETNPPFPFVGGRGTRLAQAPARCQPPDRLPPRRGRSCRYETFLSQGNPLRNESAIPFRWRLRIRRAVILATLRARLR